MQFCLAEGIVIRFAHQTFTIQTTPQNQFIFLRIHSFIPPGHYHVCWHHHDSVLHVTSVFQQSSIHYFECNWTTSREMVNPNNSTFSYLPHITAFYVQRNLETEMAIKSSGLASCKHKTMNIHSLRLWLEIITW